MGTLNFIFIMEPRKSVSIKAPITKSEKRIKTVHSSFTGDTGGSFQQRRSMREDETQNLIKKQEEKLEEIQKEQDLLKSQLKELDDVSMKKSPNNSKYYKNRINESAKEMRS